MTMQERGDASVAGNGLCSSNLGRQAMTMQQRGDATVGIRASIELEEQGFQFDGSPVWQPYSAL